MTHAQAKAILRREVRRSGYNQHWLGFNRIQTNSLAESVVFVNKLMYESEHARTRHIVRGIINRRRRWYT